MARAARAVWRVQREQHPVPSGHRRGLVDQARVGTRRPGRRPQHGVVAHMVAARRCRRRAGTTRSTGRDGRRSPRGPARRAPGPRPRSARSCSSRTEQGEAVAPQRQHRGQRARPGRRPPPRSPARRRASKSAGVDQPSPSKTPVGRCTRPVGCVPVAGAASGRARPRSTAARWPDPWPRPAGRRPPAEPGHHPADHQGKPLLAGASRIGQHATAMPTATKASARTTPPTDGWARRASTPAPVRRPPRRSALRASRRSPPAARAGRTGSAPARSLAHGPRSRRLRLRPPPGRAPPDRSPPLHRAEASSRHGDGVGRPSRSARRATRAVRLGSRRPHRPTGRHRPRPRTAIRAPLRRPMAAARSIPCRLLPTDRRRPRSADPT